MCSNRDAGPPAREGAMDASPAVFRGRRRFEFDFGRRALVRIDGWTVLPARRAEGNEEKNFIRGRETSLLQVFKGPENPLFFVTPKRQQNTKD